MMAVKPALSRDQLIRYSRHIMLKEFGVAGQQRLLASRVLLIGLGGLGSPASMYLAAAGVGEMVLVDFDHVELSNLQRQIIHGSSDIKRPKVQSARERLLGLNPDVRLATMEKALDERELADQAAAADVVVDCSDNFATRFAINAACVRTGTPLVSAAAIRFDAQITVFMNSGDGGCYRCLYDDAASGQETCAANGVASPLLGIVGSVQAMEAMKILAGIGPGLNGRLLILDGLRMEWNAIRLRRDPACPVCRDRPSQGA
ncbi:MAG: Molybdopterin-synthase adenylyltransferase [Gammaproteobacteria bacterium]|nr:Molybdopterin-synthase adenylyltransferase [Gammaproteobacteria bacterium]